MEDFVPYELAVKLNEKGFPQHITNDAYIINNYGEEEYNIGDRLPIPLVPDYMDDVAAPTISQVLKWLREEKKMFIHIDVYTNDKFDYFFGIAVQGDDTWEMEYVGEEDYRTYELAALAGIEYCLDNLI